MKKPIHFNDRKGPRMRKGEFSSSVVSREAFKKFREQFPEYKDMTWLEFSTSWNDIAETIRSESVTNPLGVKLSYYNGELKLQYVPYQMDEHVNGASYPEMEETGIKFNELNLISRGKICRLKWERRFAVKFNRMLQFFAFEPYRGLSIMASKYTEANPEKLRVSRVTLGGKRAWTGIKRKK